jgi:protein-disulfide isomerase
MKQLHATYGDNLRIIYRNFPLTSIHANAHLAAQAAEAAGKQGKFFLMHDKLFEEQNSWNDLENPTGTFIQYASALGLNIEQFTTDLESTEVKQAIADDIASGTRSNVNSTPTFFVNGTELTIQTNALDALTNAIDTAQKQAAL